MPADGETCRTMACGAGPPDRGTTGSEYPVEGRRIAARSSATRMTPPGSFCTTMLVAEVIVNDPPGTDAIDTGAGTTAGSPLTVRSAVATPAWAGPAVSA